MSCIFHWTREQLELEYFQAPSIAERPIRDLRKHSDSFHQFAKGLCQPLVGHEKTS